MRHLLSRFALLCLVLLPALGAAQTSIIAARVLVDEYPAIPLAVGALEIVDYPPGDPERAFASYDIAGEIPLDHDNFGGELPKGFHFYRVEVEDSEGRIGRSAARLFKIDDGPLVAAMEWTICTAQWDKTGEPPTTCGSVQRMHFDPPSEEGIAEVELDSLNFSQGLQYAYFRAQDDSGRFGPWREYIFDIRAPLPVIRAEYTIGPGTLNPAPAVGTLTLMDRSGPDSELVYAFEDEVSTDSLPTGYRPWVHVRAQRDIPRETSDPIPAPSEGFWGDFASFQLNRCPTATRREPNVGNPIILKGATVTFDVGGNDPDNDTLTTTLFVNETPVASGTPPFEYQFTEAGTFDVVARTSDGNCSASIGWDFQVYDGVGWILE